MAQNQDLKRKGGAYPDHQMSRNHAAPPLHIRVPTMRDFPNGMMPWSDVHLPVDILLFTAEECEYLACLAFLNYYWTSFHEHLGCVVFATSGESGEGALKIASMRSAKGSFGRGDSLVTLKDAITILRPKAAFSVGCCLGLNPESTKRGDVVVPYKLVTESFIIPLSKNMLKLQTVVGPGWYPPLKHPEDAEPIQVHPNSVIFSGSQFNTKQRHMSEPHIIAFEREGEGKILFYI